MTFTQFYLLCNKFGSNSSLTSSSMHVLCQSHTTAIHVFVCSAKMSDLPLVRPKGPRQTCRCSHIPRECLPSDRAYCRVRDASQSTQPVNYTISQSQPPARRALRPSNPHHPRITEGICWLIASARRACCSRRGADLLLE